MKYIFTVVLAVCTTLGAWAQQLKGNVVDASTNAPLPGANIVANKNIGTTANGNGNFAIDCSAQMQLTISFIGYETQKVSVTNCNDVLKIALKPMLNTMNEVEVTATTSKDKSLLEQPSSIATLERKQLDRATGLYLDDAINTSIPGVYMQRRSNSGGQQFNIRGYGNGSRGTRGTSNNFDGQGSKVYLNGIAITDAEGITVMDDIDFNSVEKVEVLKGPSGTLYGLAIAGVVNMQTKKAAPNTTAIGQDFMVGSYGLLRSTTSVSVGSANASLLVNYGHQQFDSYMPHTAAHKDFVNVVGDFAPSQKQNITTYFGYANSYDERNGEITIAQWAAEDYSGNPRYVKNDAHSAVRTFRAGVGHTYKFNQRISNTTSFFGSSQSMDASSAGGWTDKAPLSYGLRSTFDMNYRLNNKLNLKGLVGIELQKTDALAAGYAMVPDSTNLTGYNTVGALRSLQFTTNATASYFTQWTLELPKNLSITAGVGYSTMSISLTDRLWYLKNNTPGNQVPKTYEANYNNMVSPTLAINKKIGNNASVYAAYSVGYKAPVSSFFYIPTTGEVNQGLKPEHGIQIEVGTKGSLLNNRFFYTVALFQAKFENKFTTVAVQDPQNTTTLYSYMVNGGALNNKGLELLASFEFIETPSGFFTSVRPFANLTYSNFKYEDYAYQTIGKGSSNQDTALTQDYSGNQVAGVPPVVFNLGVDANTKFGFYGNAYYNYRGAMYFTSDEVNKTAAYGLLNAKIGYRKSIKKFTFDVYAAANNMLGAQAYNMVFVNQLPDAYIPAPNEINFFGGVNLKYNF